MFVALGMLTAATIQTLSSVTHVGRLHHIAKPPPIFVQTPTRDAHSFQPCSRQALTEAAAEEGGLLAAAEQSSAGAARREAARAATEAQVARLTAARLNARLTALEGELADVTAAKEALEGVFEIHPHNLFSLLNLRRYSSVFFATVSHCLVAFGFEYKTWTVWD